MNLTATITFNWENGSWQKHMKSNAIYDDSGFLTENNSQLWDIAAQDWGNLENKTVYTNDASGKPTLYEVFVAVNSEWNPYSREIITYDADDHILHRNSQIVYLSNWITTSEIDYVTLANGSVSVANFTFYDLNGSINLQRRILYEYY